MQYETRLEGKWFPVVRYDTEHGFAHRDLLDKKGDKQKTPMFTKDCLPRIIRIIMRL